PAVARTQRSRSLAAAVRHPADQDRDGPPPTPASPVTVFAGRRAALRILIVWAISAVALHAGAAFIPGVHVAGWMAAIFGAAALGLPKSLVWPFLPRVALLHT